MEYLLLADRRIYACLLHQSTLWWQMIFVENSIYPILAEEILPSENYSWQKKRIKVEIQNIR
jgi:hypothetical protein